MNLTELLAGASQEGEGVRFFIPEDWMQGRTTYGGLSTALALEVVNRSVPDLPPLRSATVSFVGPAGGEVVGRAKVLRQGRSVAFVESDLECDGRLATRCVFAFGNPRSSAYEGEFVPMPSLPAPSECEDFLDSDFVPNFTQHFEARLARGAKPASSSKATEHFIWVKHRDPGAKGGVGLIALADMPPPAIMPMLAEPAPLSSMTWMVNVIDYEPEGDGWWLVGTRAEHSESGYSSQDMFVWNEAGKLALTGRQSIAVFA